MTLVGDALWVAAYGVAIWVGYREATYAIPLPAICLNVTWELLFTFWRPPRTAIKRALYSSWFLLDLVILAQAFVYAPVAGQLGVLRAHPIGVIGLGLLASFGAHLWLYRRFARPYHVAFGLNLVMSILFVEMYFARPDGRGLSLAVAWLKFGGTALISLANLYRFRGRLREQPALTAFMAGIFFFDVSYLALLHGLFH